MANRRQAKKNAAAAVNKEAAKKEVKTTVAEETAEKVTAVEKVAEKAAEVKEAVKEKVAEVKETTKAAKAAKAETAEKAEPKKTPGRKAAVKEEFVLEFAGKQITQEEINAAVDELLSGMLQLRFKADKSLLQNLIAELEEMDFSQYTEESVACLPSDSHPRSKAKPCHLLWKKPGYCLVGKACDALAEVPPSHPATTDCFAV